MRRLEQLMQFREDSPPKSAHDRPESASTFSAATRAAFTHLRLIAKVACYLRRYNLRSPDDLSKH